MPVCFLIILINKPALDSMFMNKNIKSAHKVKNVQKMVCVACCDCQGSDVDNPNWFRIVSGH